MAEEPRSYPLVLELMKRSRLQRHWVLAIIAVVLVLLLVLVAFLDGDSNDLATLSFWRDFLDGPVLVLYILAVYPILWKVWFNSVQSLRSLVIPGDNRPDEAVTRIPLPNRRSEWVAIFIGAILWSLLWQPWERNWIHGEMWVSAYDVGTQTILFGLLGWLVYTSFVGSRYISRLSGLRLNLNVFDTEPLMPVAFSSLGFSVAFVGGISLSLVFQTREDLLRWNNLGVWAAVICFAILLFFLSIWSTHTAMGRIKKRELQIIQQKLKVASTRLNEPPSGGRLDCNSEVSSIMMMWLTYERRIKEAPEWPFNAGVIRNLMASILAPVAVFLIKFISGLGSGM